MPSTYAVCDLANGRRPSEHPTKRRLLFLICAVCVLMSLLASDGFTHSQDKDCEDFDTQRAAQDHRDTHASDPDRLDDEHGVTCPDLPCPCGATPLPPPAPTPVRSEPATLSRPVTTEARVVAVVGANTLMVRLPAGETVNVRLLGIDTLKRRGPAMRAACGAVDATARLKRLAFRNGIGRRVRVKTDPTYAREDGSGWRLAYVDAHHVDFGRSLIAAGWAKVDARDDGFLRVGIYRKAQASAKAAGRGAWRRCSSATAR